MFTILDAIAGDPTLLNPADSVEVCQRLHRFQAFLYHLISSPSSTPDPLPRLEEFCRALRSHTDRLEVRSFFRTLYLIFYT